MNDRVLVAKTCDGCHDNDDVHRGEFGQQCERCHVISKWRTLSVGAKQRHYQVHEALPSVLCGLLQSYGSVAGF